MLLSPETLEIIQKGGSYALLLIAIAWLVLDRNRLLNSLSAKDEIIADKDAKLLSLSERTITAVVEFRSTMQSVVEIFNKRSR